LYNIVDLAMLALLAVFGILGASKGFVKNAFKLIIRLCAAILPIALIPYIVRLLKELGFYAYLLGKFNPQGVVESAVSAASGNFPDNFFYNFLFSIAGAGGEVVLNSLAAAVISAAANVLLYVGLFFLIKIVLSAVAGALDKVMALPGLNAVNKLAGFLLGAGKCWLILYIIIGIVMIFVSPVDTPSIFSTSFTYKILMKNNFITKMFS